MKIGIMGGTFNPIHNGHLELAKAAYRQFSLDEVRFLPNGRPPHKSDGEIHATIAQRLAMVRLAIAADPRFTLDLYEASRSDVSYSYETMEHMTAAFPQDEFFFIIGADSLRDIETWRKPERLLRCCTMLAACRDDIRTDEAILKRIRLLNEKYNARIRLLHAPLIPVSSSEIRSLCARNKSLRGLVPEAVEAYIQKERLYGREDPAN